MNTLAKCNKHGVFANFRFLHSRITLQVARKIASWALIKEKYLKLCGQFCRNLTYFLIIYFFTENSSSFYV